MDNFKVVSLFIILAQCMLMSRAQDVGFAMTVNGISSITWNGNTFWSGASQDFPSALSWQCSDGSSSPWDTLSRTLDADGKGLTLGYHYGSTKFRYTPTGNKLKIDVTVTNTKACDITYMEIDMFKLNLPAPASNWYADNSFIICDNLMAPSACKLQGAWGQVVMTNEDPVNPLGIGFPITDNAPTNSSFRGKMFLSYPGWFPNSLERVYRKVPAGQSVTFSVTLYFGSSSVQPYTLGWDTVSKWVTQRPYIINWTDRRPLAMDVISVAEEQYQSATNPRGWFGDVNVNVFTSAGLADFRSRLMGRANVIISNCQLMGVVIWDIEGQEFPHAISYIGDPSLMPKFAPEMELYADEYIGKFKSAGMKIGFTIRPQKVLYSPDTGTVTWADQQYASDNTQALQWMQAKVQYAKNRWGASMFYVDTDTNTYGGTLDPQVFRNLQLSEPNCLFFPEWQSSGYYGVGAPYDALNLGITGTPPDARILYPNSFTMLVVNNGHPENQKQVLQQSVLAGDILMAAAWYGNGEINTIAEIYSVVSPSASPSAAAGASASPTRTPTPSPAAPSATPTRTPTPSPIPPSTTPTPSPAAPSSSPTRTPTPSPIAPSTTPTPSPVAPSSSPTRTPTPSPIPPSTTPTPSPVAPSTTPTRTPSPSAVVPTQSPSSVTSFSPISVSKSPSPSRRRVTYTLTAQGITSLVFDDKTFVNPIVPAMPAAPSVQFTDGTSAYYAAPSATALEDNGNSLALTYPYGKTKFKYSASSNKFSVDITVTNSGSKTIKFLEMMPLRFTFNSIASSWNGNYVMGSNLEGPTMASLEGTWGIVTATNEDVNKNLLIGFPNCENSPANTIFNLRVFNEIPDNMTNTFDKLERTIAPGASVTFKISLRFGVSGEKAADLISDIYTKYRRQYPFDNYWQDRRPIGMEILAVADEPYHSATNPRGWFANPNVNVMTVDGNSNFKSLLMARAQTVIDNCQIMGVIVWDIEGQQFPHPTSYIGDPRALPSLAPEMDAIVDEYFGKFKTAGLQVGVTVRPQRLSFSPGPTNATQTYLTNSDALTEIKAKVAYAITRWGASLFYVNSNYNSATAVLNPQFMRDLRTAYPNVLFVADGKMDSYFSSGAPYGRFTETSKGTPATAITLYPEAFSTVYVSDSINSNTQADVQAMVDRGEILLVRSWYYSAEMDTIGDMISKSSYVAPQNPYSTLNAAENAKPMLALLLVVLSCLFWM